MISGRNLNRKAAMATLRDGDGGETMRNTAKFNYSPLLSEQRSNSRSSGISRRNGTSHASARAADLVRDTEPVIQNDECSGSGNAGRRNSRKKVSSQSGGSIGSLSGKGLIAGTKAVSLSAPVKPAVKKTSSHTAAPRLHTYNYSEVSDDTRNRLRIPDTIPESQSGSGTYAESTGTEKPAVSKKPKPVTESILSDNTGGRHQDGFRKFNGGIKPIGHIGTDDTSKPTAAAHSTAGTVVPKKPKETVVFTDQVVPKAGKPLDITNTVSLAPEPVAPAKNSAVKNDTPIAAVETGTAVPVDSEIPKAVLAGAVPTTSKSEKQAEAAGTAALPADSKTPKEALVGAVPTTSKSEKQAEASGTAALPVDSEAPKAVLAGAVSATSKPEKQAEATESTAIPVNSETPKAVLAGAVSATGDPEKPAEATGTAVLPADSETPKAVLAGAVSATSKPKKQAEAAGTAAVPVETEQQKKTVLPANPVVSKPKRSLDITNAASLAPEPEALAKDSTAKKTAPTVVVKNNTTVSTKYKKSKGTAIVAIPCAIEIENSIDMTKTVSLAPKSLTLGDHPINTTDIQEKGVGATKQKKDNQGEKNSANIPQVSSTAENAKKIVDMLNVLIDKNLKRPVHDKFANESQQALSMLGFKGNIPGDVALKDITKIEIQRNSNSGLFNDTLKIKVYGQEIFSIPVQSEADLSQKEIKDMGFSSGGTLPVGTYHSQLMDTSIKYYKPIRLIESYLIHPNRYTSAKKIAELGENRNEWKKRAYSAGCQTVKGEANFNDMTSILEKIGFRYDNTDYIDVTIIDS